MTYNVFSGTLNHTQPNLENVFFSVRSVKDLCQNVSNHAINYNFFFQKSQLCNLLLYRVSFPFIFSIKPWFSRSISPLCIVHFI